MNTYDTASSKRFYNLQDFFRVTGYFHAAPFAHHLPVRANEEGRSLDAAHFFAVHVRAVWQPQTHDGFPLRMPPVAAMCRLRLYCYLYKQASHSEQAKDTNRGKDPPYQIAVQSMVAVRRQPVPAMPPYRGGRAFATLV